MHLSLLFLAATGPALVLGDAPVVADGRSSSNAFQAKRSWGERARCDSPATCPSAEGARRTLLQRARTGFPREQEMGRPAGERLSPLARDLEGLYQVLTGTIFEGLIISGPISEEVQQEILEIVQSLQAHLRQSLPNDEGRSPSPEVPVATYEETIRSSMSELEKRFGWMREKLLVTLSPGDRVAIAELLSTLSLHQFMMATPGHFAGALKPNYPRAVVVQLGELLDRLNPGARTALAICNLAGEALTAPKALVGRREGPPILGDLTSREVVALRIIKYLKEIYPEEPTENLSRLQVNNEWVEIAPRHSVKKHFDSKIILSHQLTSWSTLVKYQTHFADELRSVVDAGVDELRFQAKIFGQLGPWISKGYIADEIFVSRELREKYNWLRLVCDGCQDRPGREGCCALPRMIQCYREQRNRHLQACTEADMLNRLLAHGQGSILPTVKQSIPDIQLQ